MSDRGFGLLRALVVAVDAEDPELLLDADVLKALVLLQGGLDPRAERFQDLAPAFLAIWVAEREVGLVAHDLEETRMRPHEIDPPSLESSRHLNPPRCRRWWDRRRRRRRLRGRSGGRRRCGGAPRPGAPRCEGSHGRP